MHLVLGKTAAFAVRTLPLFFFSYLNLRPSNSRFFFLAYLNFYLPRFWLNLTLLNVFSSFVRGRKSPDAESTTAFFFSFYIKNYIFHFQVSGIIIKNLFINYTRSMNFLLFTVFIGFRLAHLILKKIFLFFFAFFFLSSSLVNAKKKNFS